MLTLNIGEEILFQILITLNYYFLIILVVFLGIMIGVLVTLYRRMTKANIQYHDFGIIYRTLKEYDNDA